jgi:NAD+ synthase
MTTTQDTFGPHSLEIDADREVARISATLTDYLGRARRRGVVVGLSGGIDSSVVAAVCVAALGPDRVFGLHMP